MAHRLAAEAESDLAEIWYYTATESGSTEIADRLVESVTDRFLQLSMHPHMGRRRDEDLRPGLRSFAVGAYVVLYRIEVKGVLILRVIRGSRDIPELLAD